MAFDEAHLNQAGEWEEQHGTHVRRAPNGTIVGLVRLLGGRVAIRAGLNIKELNDRLGVATPNHFDPACASCNNVEDGKVMVDAKLTEYGYTLD